METLLVDRILCILERQGGWLSFEKFMELALYDPVHGYYERECGRVGREGDFITSVSVGSVFGELIAFQLASWYDDGVLTSDTTHLSPGTGPFQIMEAGAHDGTLALDILNWMAIHRPDLYEKLDYVLLEPSKRRRDWQTTRLQSHRLRVRWLDSLPDQLVTGIILGNELLDAFPVVRLGWNAKSQDWFLWCVTGQGDRFHWSRQPTTARDRQFVEAIPRELLTHLPDAFTVEWSPSAENWWRQAARSLRTGGLLTMDYGLRNVMESFVPHRSQGTLRGYRGQRHVVDLLSDPGSVDLTAHVQWERILRAGESEGLKTDFLDDQHRWLTRVFESTLAGHKPFAPWSRDRIRQFQTLTHPEHFGRSFQVLFQRISPGHGRKHPHPQVDTRSHS
jgi:SAM-dependent MidA family methyltransferase